MRKTFIYKIWLLHKACFNIKKLFIPQFICFNDKKGWYLTENKDEYIKQMKEYLG